MTKKELIQESKKLVLKNGYSIVDTMKSEWVDFFVTKDSKIFSVLTVMPKKNSIIKDKDVRLKLISSLMHDYALIICSEEDIDEKIKSHYPQIIYLHLI